MKLAWLLLANAAVSGFVGLVGVLFPGPLFDLFGGRSDVGSQFLVRLFGAALVGEALLRGGMRDIPPGPTRTALTTAILVEYAISLAAALLAQFGGVTNAAGWAIVAPLAVFTLGYAYFRFVSPNAA